MWIRAPQPTQETAIGTTTTAVYELSQNYADREDRTTTAIIAAAIGAVVGTGAITAGIAVLLWWFRHHFRKGNAFMRRIDDWGRLQHVQTRKMRVGPETAHRTLGGQSVS